MANPSIDSNREVIDRPRVADSRPTAPWGSTTRRRRPLYFDGRFSPRATYRRAGVLPAPPGRPRHRDGRRHGAGLTPTWVSSTSGTGRGRPRVHALGRADGAVLAAHDRPGRRTRGADSRRRVRSGGDPFRAGAVAHRALRPGTAARGIHRQPDPVVPDNPGGPRSTVDGDIVEAVAATLVPYNGGGNDSDWGRRRARVRGRSSCRGHPPAHSRPPERCPWRWWRWIGA